MTLTQWSTWHLADAARADVEAETIISLSGKVFAEFARALDEGMSVEVKELLREGSMWT